MNKIMKSWSVISMCLGIISVTLSGCNAGMDSRNLDRDNNAQQRMEITGQNLGSNDNNTAPGRNIIPGDVPNNNNAPNNMSRLNMNNGNGNDMGINNGFVNDQANLGPDGRPMQGNNSGRQNDTARAENIKRQLEQMREISDVNVLVNGDNCIVGYTAADRNTDANVLRNTIASKVKQIDNRITSVTATDSPDMRTRINRLGNDMSRNMGADDMANRFRQLLNDINNSIG